MSKIHDLVSKIMLSSLLILSIFPSVAFAANTGDIQFVPLGSINISPGETKTVAVLNPPMGNVFIGAETISQGEKTSTLYFMTRDREQNNKDNQVTLYANMMDGSKRIIQEGTDSYMNYSAGRSYFYIRSGSNLEEGVVSLGVDVKNLSSKMINIEFETRSYVSSNTNVNGGYFKMSWESKAVLQPSIDIKKAREAAERAEQSSKESSQNAS
ncbi:hypothetical protein AM501_00200, partial [Aneurinibacillus migulanus]